MFFMNHLRSVRFIRQNSNFKVKSGKADCWLERTSRGRSRFRASKIFSENFAWNVYEFSARQSGQQNGDCGNQPRNTKSERRNRSSPNRKRFWEIVPSRLQGAAPTACADCRKRGGFVVLWQLGISEEMRKQRLRVVFLRHDEKSLAALVQYGRQRQPRQSRRVLSKTTKKSKK